MTEEESFACDVRTEMKRRNPRAAALWVAAEPKMAVLGIDDHGEAVPVFALGHATPKYNKMYLFVPQGEHWAPTFKKGTPAMLAEELTGPLSYLWTIPLLAADIPPIEEGPRKGTD